MKQRWKVFKIHIVYSAQIIWMLSNWPIRSNKGSWLAEKTEHRQRSTWVVLYGPVLGAMLSTPKLFKLFHLAPSAMSGHSCCPLCLCHLWRWHRKKHNDRDMFAHSTLCFLLNSFHCERGRRSHEVMAALAPRGASALGRHQVSCGNTKTWIHKYINTQIPAKPMFLEFWNI